MILPGTGRGTTEGGGGDSRPDAAVRGASPLHPAASRRGPPPPVGEDRK
jgi:hypothetical protein